MKKWLGLIFIGRGTTKKSSSFDYLDREEGGSQANC